ncbi:MAG: hypothetical protein ACYTG0_31995 [Planctomycetota bacterium]|jgi:hypothetical protein
MMSDPDVRDALEQILNYAWNDELLHFWNCGPDDRENHIFRALVTLHNDLCGETATPEEIVESVLWGGEQGSVLTPSSHASTEK